MSRIDGPKLFPDDSIIVAVVGVYLKHCALHWKLERVNETFVKSTAKSKSYELYFLPECGPVLKPGLRRVTDDSGYKIELELYSIPKISFGEFVVLIPEPLGIGLVELDSGT